MSSPTNQPWENHSGSQNQSGIRKISTTPTAKKSSQSSVGRNQPQKSKPPKSKSKIVLKVLMYLLLAVLGLGIGGFGYVSLNIFGQIGYTDINIVSAVNETYAPVDLGEFDNTEVVEGDTSSAWAAGGHTKVYVDPKFPIKQVAQKDSSVENILVFGIDARGSDDVKARADAVMIVSMDKRTNTLKLISIMRDTGVTIEGRSSTDKLTHAYFYGGVGLLINTINENFGLDIQRFAMLDFKSSAGLIDLVGGIDIDVLPKEVKYANQSINEQNMLLSSSVPLLTQSGYQTLNGVQAIAWSRIRHADSDFVRTNRQREVANALISKVASQNTLTQLAVLKDSAGMFETNMTQADLLRVGTVGVSMARNVEQYRIPDDGLYTVQPDPWMMFVKWEKQIPLLHSYIWGETNE